MVAVLYFEPLADPLTPGSSVATQLTIRNAGSHVDMFLVEAVGPLAEHVQFSVPGVNLLPDTEEVVVVTISPPRAPKPEAGRQPLAVKVTPQKNPDEPSTEEVVVEVVPFVAFDVELAPKNSRGGRKGKHELAIENVGNQPATVELSGYDEDQQLSVDVSPARFDLRPGDQGFAEVEVRPAKRFFRGSDVQHRYQILAASHAAEPHFQQATYTQRALLPPWFGKALAAGLLALAGLIALFLLARDNITSSAEQAAKEQAEESLEASGIQPVDTDTGEPVGPPPENPPAPGGDGGGAGDGDGAGLADSSAVSFRLAAGDLTRPVPEGGRLLVSDIIFSNPNGEEGFVRVLRGATVLVETQARNFRDLDQHFRIPLEFTSDEPLVLQIECGTCSALFSGEELTPGG